MVSSYVVLGGVLHRIIGPPWHIERSTGGDGGWIKLGIASVTAPLVTSPATTPHYPVSEALCFAADPPDTIAFQGDVLYLRSWQPEFITTDSGDLIIAEGLE